MAENAGRSITSDNDYLNKSFLFIQHTSIRADWLLIKKRLVAALSASDTDSAVSFEQWAKQAQQHYSLSASSSSLTKEWKAKKKQQVARDAANKDNKFELAVDKSYATHSNTDNVIVDQNRKLRDEEREYEQSQIAQTMMLWLTGQYPVENQTEYPYIEQLEKLNSLRQQKGKQAGSLSYKSVADFRDDFDSHMYWLHYIKPYLGHDDNAVVPPKPGAHKPYVSRGAFELVHQLDGLINIFLTLAPTFEFPKIFALMPKNQLSVLLNYQPDVPSSFSQFKHWLVPEIRYKRLDPTTKTKLDAELAKMWFCMHWINKAKGGDWQAALMSIYEGQVEDLFVALIEASKKSEKIKLQLEQFGLVSDPELNTLISAAANYLSAFVRVNMTLLKHEKELVSAAKQKHEATKLSEYETLFSSVISNAVYKRSLRVGRVLSKLSSDSDNKKSLDLYTRVKKSTSLASRMLPFIFYYSDMQKRYYHWFNSDDERREAVHHVEEKLNYAQFETGEGPDDFVTEQASLLIGDIRKQLFSFRHSDPAVRQLKNIFAAALVEKYYCADDERCAYFFAKALEQETELHDMPNWPDIVNQVSAYIKNTHQSYPRAGFDTIEADVEHIVGQLSVCIADYQSELI